MSATVAQLAAERAFKRAPAEPGRTPNLQVLPSSALPDLSAVDASLAPISLDPGIGAGLDPRTLAIVAAAVAVAAGPNARIRSIVLAAQPGDSCRWPAQGRVLIHHSHDLPQQRRG